MGDEKLPTQDAELLGEMPEPQIEPGETNPGGADALPDDESVEPADLDPDKNPATEPDVPDILKEGEDTETEATKGDGTDEDGDGADGTDADIAPEEESPA